MKRIDIKLFLSFLIGLTVFLSCKKNKETTATPDQITASEFVYNIATKKLTPATSVNAKITSAAGVKFIYCYLVRDNAPDSIIHIAYPTAAEQQDFTLSIPASSFISATTHISGVKLQIKHVDNTNYEGFIKGSAFVPSLPKLENFPASLLPDANNKILVTGKASSANGLKKIEIFDDSQGGFSLVGTITGLNNALTTNVSYDYTYRAKTANLQIIVTDNFDLTATTTINVPVLPYTLISDVNMGAQGTNAVTVTNNFFITEPVSIKGSCDLSANEATMDFLFYGTSTGPSFYAPSNTTNVATNFKCNATGWTISNPSSLKATRFRVLVPGTTATDNVYAKYNSNNITDLTDAGLFNGIAVPSSSTSRYDAVAAATTSIFNTTTAYLIWVRIPKADGTFRNCLIRAKEVVFASTIGLSTTKFDILIQK
jgi:hypothetical protein